MPVIDGVEVNVADLHGEAHRDVEGDEGGGLDVDAVEAEAGDFEVGVAGVEEVDGEGEEEERAGPEDAAAGGGGGCGCGGGGGGGDVDG